VVTYFGGIPPPPIVVLALPFHGHDNLAHGQGKSPDSPSCG